MYEAFFDLRERPFAAACRVERYFPASSIETARQNLTRCVQRAEGVGVIIGRSGTGKTLLCQVLVHHFRGQFATALLDSGRICTRRALLQAILFELGLPYRGLEEGELRLSLLDHLSNSKTSRAGLVLIIDEAHALPTRLLDELRMLTNLVRDGQPRVRLVLAGSPALEERFTSPKLDSFTQRLVARCYLNPLTRDESIEYVRSQITSAGGNPEGIYEPDAIETIHRATDGVPRLINQLCDHALILAGLGGQRPLTAATIEEAWADLQQLPTPWTESSEADSGVVEFGSGLDAHSDELPEAIPFRDSSIDATAASPTAQLHRIEQHLAELEDDFEPVGSIGPEVELRFDSISDPFGERFEEEEVVLDRYASLEDEAFARRPQVASREGQELAALLDACSQAQAEPKLAVRGASGETSAAQSRQPKEHNPPPAAVPLRSVPIAAGDSADDDLIVIEDEAHLTPANAPTAPLVRRQEYGQLFAKLRRS